MQKKSTILRELLEADEILFMPALAIPVQAQIAEKAGFKAVGLSGANTAGHILGLPDAGLITMTELAENVQRISRSVNIPVVVDCDTGFGNAINVRRTVETMIRAGAAGLFIEDQVAPKRCGFVKGKEVVSLEEAVGKYRAALDARDELDPDFVIMARCAARTAVGGSVTEVIRRLKGYREAGADVVYAEALQSVDEIKQVRAAVDGLLYCSPHAIRPFLTLQQMQELGSCLAFAQIAKAGLVAVWDLVVDMKQRGMNPLNEFREKTKDHPLGGLFGGFDLAGFPKVAEWEKKYLSPEKLAKYEDSQGLYDPRVGQSGKDK